MIEFNSNASLFGANNIEKAKGQQASQIGSSDFDTELSQAIASALEQFGINPSQVNISITPNTTPATSAPTTEASTSSPATTSINTPQAATTASTASTSEAVTPQSFDEQYWSDQPTAVQQLQNMSDPTARSLMAGQLATEGYKIDVPIMVWGWDPSSVTALRQEFGYTWVPSAYQQPIQEAPGMQLPGLTPYDPNDPPQGSIAV